MSFRCRGVNSIVFIAPSHHPHGSNHQGTPDPVSFGNCRKYWNGETIRGSSQEPPRAAVVAGRREGEQDNRQPGPPPNHFSETREPAAATTRTGGHGRLEVPGTFP